MIMAIRMKKKNKWTLNELMFVSKKIAIGITGGIAAYKTCELIRELKKSGADVRVGMSKSAKEFVSQLTYATLSENPVLTSLFEQHEKEGIAHIDLARWCDVLVICPATANFLGKVAAGLADDILSTTVMTTESDVLFCPAMNSVMWSNPIVQKNVSTLKDAGYEFLEPEWGALATTSEGEGWGRLAAIETILQKLRFMLFATKELQGKKVVVTAGPTREPIDPVRYITNYSSGKMGFTVAEAAKLRGAEVVLISGPNHLQKPQGVKYIEVENVDEMQKAVDEEYSKTNILVMAAAVSDYRPKKAAPKKIKKSTAEFTLSLKKTQDILASLATKKADRVHVGFALETDDGVANALKKLNKKNLDLIVLNNPLEAGAAFAGDTNIVTLIGKDGSIEELPKLPKNKVAELILDKVGVILSESRRQKAAM